MNLAFGTGHLNTSGRPVIIHPRIDFKAYARQTSRDGRRKRRAGEIRAEGCQPRPSVGTVIQLTDQNFPSQQPPLGRQLLSRQRSEGSGLPKHPLVCKSNPWARCGDLIRRETSSGFVPFSEAIRRRPREQRRCRPRPMLGCSIGRVHRASRLPARQMPIDGSRTGSGYLLGQVR